MPERTAPVQGDQGVPPHSPDYRSPGLIDWWEHEDAWRAYDEKWHCGQSASRIAERGGFGWDELVEFLGHEPTTWRPR